MLKICSRKKKAIRCFWFDHLSNNRKIEKIMSTLVDIKRKKIYIYERI